MDERKDNMQKNKNLYEKISRIAYDFYEKRGKVHGYDLEDWLEAERIVMERRVKEIKREAKAISSAKRQKATKKAEPKTLKSSQKKPGKTAKKTAKK